MRRLVPLCLLAASLAACASRAIAVSAGHSPPPTCPLEGCDGSRVRSIASSSPPEACPASGEAPCAGEPPAQCTRRALSAWSQATDDRAVGCLARMLTDACSLGDPPACGHAGRLLLDGRGVPRDIEQGVALLTRACDGGFALACRVAVRWLADAEHAKMVTDAPELRARLDGQHECLQGVRDECLSVGLGFYHARDGFPHDLALSARAYARGCDLGQRIACNNLGDAYEYGEGVDRDLSRAAAQYERACGLGEALGCANLGHLVENGEGVTRDLARARALYRDGCVAGDVYGCLHLELSALESPASPAEAARALARWERGCGARDARACAFVGLIYEDGPDGLSRDEKKSQAAMTRGCDLGERRACDWMRTHGP